MPWYYSRKKAERFLDTKSAWIREAQARQARIIHPELPDLQSNREIYYLGKLWSLETYDAKKPKVELHESSIKVFGADSQKRQKALLAFYKEETRRWVEHYLKHYINAHDIKISSVGFRRYKKRWGSCSHDNALMFNTLLSRLDVSYIEYVVVHELSHVTHKHHRSSFYQQGEKFLTGFRELGRNMLK